MSDFVKNTFNIVNGCKGLAHNHPVFLLLVDNNAPVVIKRESSTGSAPSMQHNFKMMKAVSPSAAAKVLDNTERQAIIDYLADSLQYAMDMREAEPDGTAALRTQWAQSGTWIKMHQAPGIMDLNGAIQALITSQDKSGVRQIAKALNNSGGFETLGQIVAADLYNHNTDRFVPSTLGWGAAANDRIGKQNGSFTKFKALGNVGNVLITIKNKTASPIGLDSFDPNSDYADVSRTIEDLENQNVYNWLGRFLARNAAADRQTYAQEIYDDLESAVGPRKRTGLAKAFNMSDKRLKNDGPKRILAGMEVGTKKIKEKLALLIRKAPTTSAGLQSRLNIIS